MRGHGREAILFPATGWVVWHRGEGENEEWYEAPDYEHDLADAMGLAEAWCDKDPEHREWHMERMETKGVRSYQAILFSFGEIDGFADEPKLPAAITRAVAGTH
jgi:hypothetical protein